MTPWIKQRPSLFWQRSILFLLLLFSWASIAGRITLIFIPFILLAAIVLAVFWKSKIIITIVLLNPMAIAFYQGASEWLDERPAFTGNGLPNYEASNLDRDTRCYRNIGGCVVYGGEWVYHDSHNAGLRLMTTVFGPPPKTYHGPYPTFQEATNATAHTVTISAAQFESGSFEVDGRKILLGPQITDSIVSDLGLCLSPETQVRAAIWENGCLIIHLRSLTMSRSSSDPAEGVYLLQVKNLKPIARFMNGNGYPPRIPRLR